MNSSSLLRGQSSPPKNGQAPLSNNYIVCIAHFCEVHGPSIVICTQQETSALYHRHLIDGDSGSRAKSQTCASCQLILPHEAANATTSEGDLVYVSAQYPRNQKRYTVLTKLALKALSCETTSDITKPMFYGDAVSGYCIFKIFKIKDINARGGERKYAVMIVGENEAALLMHWNVVSLYFNEVITVIQSRLHSEAKTKLTTMMDHERYLRRSIIRPKSLIEMTGDNQIYIKLHLWAVQLLKDMTDSFGPPS
ncbi:protein Lst7p [Diutina catenulata]